MDLGLSGKRVLVTGSSRGIGLAIARAFLDEGATVVLNGVDESRLSGAAAALPAEGKVFSIAADISRSDEVQRLFKTIDDKVGGLDVLVNNAAIYPDSEFATLAESDWDRVIDTNVKSIYLCAKQAYARMAAGQGGVILNASSLAARIAVFPRGLYSVSKAAVSSLTQVLAAEFAPANIRVNAYMPGSIETETSDGPLSDLALSQIALRRSGRPEEVAAPVVFLASPRASYITGAILEIAGGKFAVQYPAAAWPNSDRGRS